MLLATALPSIFCAAIGMGLLEKKRAALEDGDVEENGVLRASSGALRCSRCRVVGRGGLVAENILWEPRASERGRIRVLVVVRIGILFEARPGPGVRG